MRPTLIRRPRLFVEPLERRLAPAVFNIPAGDTAALVAAITACNTNNQADTIELAANSTYMFATAADPADGGSALPTILRDTAADANTVTVHGNGATLQRSAAAGTPTFRLVRTGVFPDNVAVTITDLTFANGDAGLGRGGAIYLQAGDLTLTRCTFQSDRADTGGAVYATTTSGTPRLVSIADSTFTGNVTTGSNNGGAGGAVYLLGSSSLDLHRNTFSTNTAFREGGAVRVQTSSGTITIADCLVTNNTAGGGGGVFVQGPTTVTNTVVQNNVSSGTGGGIWVQSGGSLVLTGGSITGNRVTGTSASGGGVYSQSSTTISNATIQNNTTGANGGGVFVQGSLSLTGSTVSDNQSTQSTAGGGGVYCQGPLTILNSTIHNNRAGNGGGVAFVSGTSFVGSITHSTITDNRAYFGLAIGGGLEVTGSGRLDLGTTIVAGNSLEATATSGTGPDVGGTVNSLGYNLIQDPSGATFTGTTAGNVTGVAAGLGPLANNGGPTPTRLPLLTSPARDAGDPVFAPPPATDQAGRPRVLNGRVDIGATEYPAATVAALQVNDGTVQRSMVWSLTVTFSGLVTFAGGDTNAAAAFVLTRTGAAGGTVTLHSAVSTNALGQTVVTLTFAGGAATDPFTAQNGGPLSLANGRFRLDVLSAAVTGADGQALDGDADGVAGGDYHSPADTAGGGAGYHYGLYRLCGDATGNGVDDLLDLAALRSAFNAAASDPAYLRYFDFDNNGVIDLNDLAYIRPCFNASVFVP